MQKVQFVSASRGNFTSALRNNVNNYFKQQNISAKGNAKIITKSIIMMALYFVPFILILTLPIKGAWIFPFSIIMGVGMAGIGMSVMHDAMHGSFSKKPWLNKLLGNSIYLIGGNTFNWKIQHNFLHHTYTNIQGLDEDIEPKGMLRLSQHTPLKRIHRFQYIYAFFLYCLMTTFRMVNEFSQLIKYNRLGITAQQKSSPRKEIIILALTKATYLSIFIGLPLLFSEASWSLIFIGFLLTHVIASVIMSVVFQLAHVVEEAQQPQPDTQGVINAEWTVHELATTVNFARSNWFVSWITGGLNYQIEHHLFPHICHVHYKALSPIVESTAKEFGLKYNANPTFRGAFNSHVRQLRALGK